jgi:hypothetical protein
MQSQTRLARKLSERERNRQGFCQRHPFGEIPSLALN